MKHLKAFFIFWLYGVLLCTLGPILAYILMTIKYIFDLYLNSSDIFTATTLNKMWSVFENKFLNIQFLKDILVNGGIVTIACCLHYILNTVFGTDEKNEQINK